MAAISAVGSGSCTPTFAALRIFINNWRWKGVPFYVRVFPAGRSRIRVGSLQNLLRMKEIAARDKDLLFLEKYRQMLREH